MFCLPRNLFEEKATKKRKKPSQKDVRSRLLKEGRRLIQRKERPKTIKETPFKAIFHTVNMAGGENRRLTFNRLTGARGRHHVLLDAALMEDDDDHVNHGGRGETNGNGAEERAGNGAEAEQDGKLINVIQCLVKYSKKGTEIPNTPQKVLKYQVPPKKVLKYNLTFKKCSSSEDLSRS